MLRLPAGPPHRRFAELDCETSAKAPQKLPNGVLTLQARWISVSIALSPSVFLLD